MKYEWPLGKAGEAADADNPQPLLPLALDEHIAAIMATPAIAAFARKRAVQIVEHGHTAEQDLERDLVHLVNEAKNRLHAFIDIVPRGRMNLTPVQRDRALRYLEIGGALLIAAWLRCQVEVDRDWLDE